MIICTIILSLLSLLVATEESSQDEEPVRIVSRTKCRVSPHRNHP